MWHLETVKSIIVLLWKFEEANLLFCSGFKLCVETRLVISHGESDHSSGEGHHGGSESSRITSDDDSSSSSVGSSSQHNLGATARRAVVTGSSADSKDDFRAPDRSSITSAPDTNGPAGSDVGALTHDDFGSAWGSSGRSTRISRALRGRTSRSAGSSRSRSSIRLLVRAAGLQYTAVDVGEIGFILLVHLSDLGLINGLLKHLDGLLHAVRVN